MLHSHLLPLTFWLQYQNQSHLIALKNDANVYHDHLSVPLNGALHAHYRDQFYSLLYREMRHLNLILRHNTTSQSLLLILAQVNSPSEIDEPLNPPYQITQRSVLLLMLILELHD